MEANSSSRLFRDNANARDILRMIEHKAGPTKTRIIIKDHDTGEVLQNIENKVLVPGSQSTACKQFGISPIVNFPTYNTELNLDNHCNHPDFPAIQPFNEPITCLWCAGRLGASGSPNEVYTVSNTDRILPDVDVRTDGLYWYKDIVPFRYVSPDYDLDYDQRQIYFGRKEFTNNNRVGYFFKAFDTLPQLHIRYLDGTEVTKTMYSIDSSQQVETYVEMRLSVTRKDFRDYFDEVIGWDNANISSISLCTAWYDNVTHAEDDSVSDDQKVYYKWYYDILPYSKFNFNQESLVSLNRAIDFNYQVYF